MRLIKNFLNNLTSFRVIHIILFVGFITYANALFNPFIWDDSAYILFNPLLQTSNFFNYFEVNIFNNTGQYRPLTIAYFALLNNTFGNTPFFYHFIQILLHIINTSLLFILFKSFIDKRVALFLSLVFLVHPMQVESVSYISAAGGALSFFLGMIALVISTRKRKKKLLTFLQFLLLLASALVKETGILFVPLVIIYQWLFENKNLTKNIIYSSTTIIVYLFIRLSIGNIAISDRPLIPVVRLTILERMITIPEVIWYYIKTFFFPVSLAIDQHWVITNITFQDFYLPLILDLFFLGIIILLGFYIYKIRIQKLKMYLFFCSWLFMGLTLHSQIIPLDMTVADRWFYFSMAGLLGIIGISLQALSSLFKQNWKTIAAILSIFIIIFLITKTIIRNFEWSDHARLYTHDITVSDNFLIQEEFALDLIRNGKLKEALIPARKSVEYFPHEENLYNLGYIYEMLGNFKKAKEHYAKALKANNYTPGENQSNVTIYIRLANILLYYEDPNSAKQFINDSLKHHPKSDRLWLLLALSEYKLKNQTKALNAAEHAYKLSPNSKINNTVYMNLLKNKPIDIKFGN